MSLQRQQKWVIGLTGAILSGKSTALAYFKQAGAEVICCDEIVRQLYRCPAVLKKIKEGLGTADKQALIRLIFKDAAKRKKLEAILHPLILKRARARMNQCSKKLVVWEVPLLFEIGWEKWTDLTICIVADPATLPARLKGRKMSRVEYERRLKTQFAPVEKAARADIVFVHKNKTQLKKSVLHFCRAFNVLQKNT